MLGTACVGGLVTCSVEPAAGLRSIDKPRPHSQSSRDIDTRISQYGWKIRGNPIFTCVVAMAGWYKDALGRIKTYELL